MTPRAILAALLVSIFLAAIFSYMTDRKWKPPANGEPFCQYPLQRDELNRLVHDFPMCEFKLRSAYIVNNG